MLLQHISCVIGTFKEVTLGGRLTLKFFWAISNDITADQVLSSKPFLSKEFVV